MSRLFSFLVFHIFCFQVLASNTDEISSDSLQQPLGNRYSIQQLDSIPGFYRLSDVVVYNDGSGLSGAIDEYVPGFTFIGDYDDFTSTPFKVTNGKYVPLNNPMKDSEEDKEWEKIGHPDLDASSVHHEGKSRLPLSSGAETKLTNKTDAPSEMFTTTFLKSNSTRVVGVSADQLRVVGYTSLGKSQNVPFFWQKGSGVFSFGYILDMTQLLPSGDKLKAIHGISDNGLFIAAEGFSVTEKGLFSGDPKVWLIGIPASFPTASGCSPLVQKTSCTSKILNIFNEWYEAGKLLYNVHKWATGVGH